MLNNGCLHTAYRLYSRHTNTITSIQTALLAHEHRYKYANTVARLVPASTGQV